MWPEKSEDYTKLKETPGMGTDFEFDNYIIEVFN